MAKKNLKIDIDTDRVDVKVDRKDGETEVIVDGKNLDVHVKKTNEGNEVEVKAEKGFLKMVGKVIGKILLRRLK